MEEFERTSTDVSWSTMLDFVPNKSSDFPCPIAQGCGRLSSSRPSLPPPVRRNLEETGQDRQSEKNEEKSDGHTHQEKAGPLRVLSKTTFIDK